LPRKIKTQLASPFIIFFFIMTFFSSNAFSFDGKPSIRFKHLTIEDGLPQNSVQVMLQDSTGFLWIGTEEGLVRYDGYSLKVFKHEANNSNSLSGNYILSLLEDSQGNLWVGTRGGGLNQFDSKTQQFTHYRHRASDANSLSNDEVRSLVEDAQGNLWVGTRGGGLNQFDSKTQQFTHYRHRASDANSLSHDNVYSLLEDSQGNLWVGTRGGGLNYFNLKTQQFTHYRLQTGDANSLSNDTIWSLIEDRQGNIWVGTNGGLNQFTPKTQQFSHYRHQTSDANSLSNDYVRSVMEDRQGNLWVGTRGGGLNQFNPKTQQFTHYRHQASGPNSLSDDNVFSLLEDSQGNLWVGTNGGLNQFNPITQLFTHYRHQTGDANTLSHDNVYSLLEDSQGNLWVGTNGGLNQFNPITQQFTHYRHKASDSNSLSSDIVLSLLEDSQGNLWVGTNGGLNQFNPITHQFTHYRHKASDSNSLSSDIVLSLIEDSQGNLWVGTLRGLNWFNPKTQQFTHYHHQTSDANSLSNDNVRSIIEDSQGNLWVGTRGGGLNHFNPKTQQFIHYYQKGDANSLSHDNVRSIIEDSQGNLWVGTPNGLNLFDKKTANFKRFTTENGLPNNVIYRIEEDNQGDLWLSTNQGLSRMNPKSETFRNYDVGDGLQSNEFNVFSSFKNQSGELFFGGINGFNRFYPENIIDDTQLPKVLITEMLILNKPAPINPLLIAPSTFMTNLEEQFSLTQVIHKTKAITLTHTDNIVAFEFAALHFNNPKKNQFAYQLVGWDNDWVSTDYKNRRATYTNLPDGDYIFRVKASNGDGYWNEEGTSLHITVLPPPWKTWWAYTLYGLFLLSLVLAFIHSQRKKVLFERNVNAQLEDKVVERTSQLQYKTEELQKYNTLLEEMSLTDQLTGLKNRRYLLNNIENDIALVLRKYKSSHENMIKSKPESADHIFFLIDLDHFKMVNDIHGHTAGDAVLIQVKAILEQVFRETDYLVRWGGEEFLVIARFTERNNASELAERLRLAVENHDFDIGDNKILNKTCSIGFACYPFSTVESEALSWEQVVDVADHCMYAAKKSSRNAWVGINNKIEVKTDELFTKVVGQTEVLIQSGELGMLTSITESDQVSWETNE
jgi:diguanylate cyclase (GGDEF)-like protein